MERQDGIQQLRQAEEEAQRRVEEARQREHIWCSFFSHLTLGLVDALAWCTWRGCGSLFLDALHCFSAPNREAAETEASERGGREGG